MEAQIQDENQEDDIYVVDADRTDKDGDKLLVATISRDLPYEERRNLASGLCDMLNNEVAPTDAEYNDRIDGNQQANAEMWLMDYICNNTTASEEVALELGRDILKEILRRFRPDLFNREEA